MAKKKVVSKPSSNAMEHKENLPNNHEQLQEKMASLQTLNNLLVRETVELREHVNTLQRSKEMCESEKISLEGEKNKCKQLSEEQCEVASARTEIEQSINRVFVSSQIAEQEENRKNQVQEMERLLNREADISSLSIRNFEKAQVEKKELESLITVLENKLECMMGEKEDKEKVQLEQEVIIDELRRQVCDLEKMVDQEIKLNSCLNQKVVDLGLVMKENKELETLICVFETKLQVLMKEKEDKERALLKQELQIAELQKQIGDLEKVVGQETEINLCLNQKMADFELVKMEKKELESMISVFETKLETLIKENKDKERVQIEQEIKIAELQKEVNEISAHISALQEECTGLKESKQRLQGDLNVSRETCNHFVCERDSIRKELGSKEGETEVLRTMVAEMEKKNMEIIEKLEGLRMEKDLAQKRLVENQRRFEQVLIMVKKVGKKICECEDGDVGAVVVDEDDEIRLFGVELEAIFGAFRNRVGEIKKMNQEMVSLQVLVEKKEKQGRFWTWVSSATVFLAASAIAYVAKWRSD